MLVVDDEVPVGRSLARWLKRRGVEVVVINDPLLFEAAVADLQPAWIISDYLMPGRSGVEVLRLARTLAPQAGRCLLSGSLSDVSAAERESLAPCHFLEKPWENAALAQALGLPEEGHS